jgi:hypothetical protein
MTYLAVLRLFVSGRLLILKEGTTSLLFAKTTWILTSTSVKLQKFALREGIRYMVSSLLVKFPLLYKYIVSLIKQDCFAINNKDFTIPKNIILNWLYATDKHVSLVKLGKWLELNTGGKYKLVDTDAQT